MTPHFSLASFLSENARWWWLLLIALFSLTAAKLVALRKNALLKQRELAQSLDSNPFGSGLEIQNSQKKASNRHSEKDFQNAIECLRQQNKEETVSMILLPGWQGECMKAGLFNTPPTPKPNSGRKAPLKSSQPKKRKSSNSKPSSATHRKSTSRPRGRTLKRS